MDGRSDHPVGPDDTSEWPAEAVVALEPPFVDDRGAIQPLVDRRMLSAVLITSKKGAVRANHYHKTDWHYCYVVSGSIEYFYREHGSTDPPQRLVAPAGTMFFTPPMVDHAMRFSEETVFLALSRNRRDHDSYESDVVRVEVIRG